MGEITSVNFRKIFIHPHTEIRNKYVAKYLNGKKKENTVCVRGGCVYALALITAPFVDRFGHALADRCAYMSSITC